MKKQILLLVCAGLMQPFIAGSPGEETPLIQSPDEENQTELQEQPINRWKLACLSLTAILVGTGVGVGVSYGIIKAHSGGEAPEGAPQCNPVLWNRTDAHCVSTDPSEAWTPVCSQLNAMRKRSKKSCVPACHWRLENSIGVFPTGPGKETTLPEQEFTRFQQLEYNDYGFVVCENEPDSWLHTLKEYFFNNSIPFFKIKTAPGAEVNWEKGSAQLQEYPTQGLVYPKQYNDEVYDTDLYNSHTIQDADPTGCRLENGEVCEGTRFK